MKEMKEMKGMNRRILFILSLCMATISLHAQTKYLTEDEDNIYWQPSAQIDYADYQSPSDTACIKYNERHGIPMASSIGIRGVVDMPKKKKKKYEKFYLAPAFCKNCSCILSEDSLCLKTDRLLFDIAELFARYARKDLLEYQKEMKTDNTYTMFFNTVKNHWDEQMQNFFGGTLREILIEKKEGAYEEWRQMIDEALEETEDYATKPEECYRFISGKPVDKDYKMAIYLVDDMRNIDTEE